MDVLKEFRKVNNESLQVTQAIDSDWLQHAATVEKNGDGIQSVVGESEQRFLRGKHNVSPLLASLINRI